MKVLYLIETLGVGGAERSLLQMIPRLGSDVRPVMCHIYGGDALRERYEAAGVPVVSLNIPPKYHFPTALRRVNALIDRERPDLIHTTLFRAEVVGRIVGWRRSLPVICSFVSECYADIRWRSLSAVGRFKLGGIQVLDRLTAPLATHFIANSATIKRSEAHSIGVEPDRVTVIYRGRAPADFAISLSADERAQCSAALCTPPGAPIVLSVGRLVFEKGHRELIDAFARVLARWPLAVLLIAGDGPEYVALQKQIEALGMSGNVRLLGCRNDIPQLLAFADLFVSTSHYEGHPGAVVEAMLAAKPIVLSDTPVHRETVADGRGARLVRLQDAEAIATGIHALLADPQRACLLGKEAQQLAQQLFDVEKTAAHYTALYRHVVKAHAEGLRRVPVLYAQAGSSAAL
jgi:glycosyltransferase involved in cell wall biosynthesis